MDAALDNPAVAGARPAVKRKPPTGAKNGYTERLEGLHGGSWSAVFGYLLVAFMVFYGWRHRGDVYLSPEQGAGYALGIIGAGMMALLLLYPLRKKARWMRGLGQVRHWFRAHMLMGVIGPVCILYHCNFQLGSMNGNVALFSMLLVATSGLLGRYLYTRIHYGLYGKKADLERLGSDAVVIRNFMHRVYAADHELQAILTRLEEQALRQPGGFFGSLVHVLRISFITRWWRMRALNRLRKAHRLIARRDDLKSADLRRLRDLSVYYLNIYLETIRRVAGFTFYERLFSLWHVLHLPLFLMLLLSGVIHVYAVHLY
jgi:hypothetical protein